MGEHGPALPGRAGEHDHADPLRLKGHAGGGAPVVVQHVAPLREHGLRVPDDIAVLSFGGEDALPAYLYPPLSCIETDRTKFGEYTAELLTAALTGANGKMPQQLKIEPKLVMRSSI